MASDGIRILLVEDNPGDARLVREAVKDTEEPRFELISAGSLAEAFGCLEEERIDLVLLDLGLPDSQGLETVTRTRKEYPGATIVVLTGLNDEATAISALQCGAQDYLAKGQIDGRLLVRAVRYAIERTRRERADALRKSQSRQVWKALYRIMGQGSSPILYQAGVEAGRSMYDFVQENWRPRSEDQFLSSLREHLMFAGICSLKEFEFQAQPLRVSIRAQDNFEIDIHGDHSEAPACHFLRGLLCGLASRLSNAQDLICDETACQGKGDAICVFHVHRMFE